MAFLSRWRPSRPSVVFGDVFVPGPGAEDGSPGSSRSLHGTVIVISGWASERGGTSELLLELLELQELYERRKKVCEVLQERRGTNPEEPTVVGDAQQLPQDS